jgi:hypothetical protein
MRQTSWSLKSHPPIRHIYISTFLVDIECLHLIIRLAQLLVLAHKHNLCNPRQRKRRNRESRRTAQRSDVARPVGLGPQVWSPEIQLLDYGTSFMM